MIQIYHIPSFSANFSVYAHGIPEIFCNIAEKYKQTNFIRIW